MSSDTNSAFTSLRNCPRCQNHGLVSIWKGHKNYCNYSQCKCGLCNTITKRNRKMALRIAARRKEAQDQEHAFLMGFEVVSGK